MFPECYLTFDNARNVVHKSDPMIKDVCADCNNKNISYIDNYAKKLIGRYFRQKYEADTRLEIEYDYSLLQKVLLKYAFNDLRSHKDDISFFDAEMLHYLMNEDDNTSKPYVSILGGLAVNVSPAPDFMFGNLKIRWCKNPMFIENSTVRNIDYVTGQVTLNEEVGKQKFKDLCFSYAFRFNSVQFILMCWNKDSQNIEQNNVILKIQYPYAMFTANQNKTTLTQCTDEFNYYHFEQIHVSWDGLFEVGMMRKAAMGHNPYLEELKKAWTKEEEKLQTEHPRK